MKRTAVSSVPSESTVRMYNAYVRMMMDIQARVMERNKGTKFGEFVSNHLDTPECFAKEGIETVVSEIEEKLQRNKGTLYGEYWSTGLSHYLEILEKEEHVSKKRQSVELGSEPAAKRTRISSDSAHSTPSPTPPPLTRRSKADNRVKLELSASKKSTVQEQKLRARSTRAARASQSTAEMEKKKGASRKGSPKKARKPKKGKDVQSPPRKIKNEEERRNNEDSHEVVDLTDDEDNGDAAPSPPKKDKDFLVTHKSTTLTFADMKGLFFDELVNDSIVDFYLSVLKENIHPKWRDDTHVFSSFFFKRLTQGMKNNGIEYESGAEAAAHRFDSVARNFEAVKKWTKKMDLFKMTNVVIPVVADNHWFLILILNPSKCIVLDNGGLVDNVKAREKGYKGQEPVTQVVILDSLYDAGSKKRQTTIDIIRDYLELEFENNKASYKDSVLDRTRIGEIRPKGLPQQTNFRDCGFFLMKHAEDFLNPSADRVRMSKYSQPMSPRGFMLEVRYMREKVVKVIEKLTDKEVWNEYKRYERLQRDQWSPSRKQEEAIHMARRRRCESEKPLFIRRRRARSPSTPPCPSSPELKEAVYANCITSIVSKKRVP